MNPPHISLPRMSDSLYYQYPAYTPVSNAYKFPYYPSYGLPMPESPKYKVYLPMVMGGPPLMSPPTLQGPGPVVNANAIPSYASRAPALPAGGITKPKRKRAKSSPSHLVPLTNKFSANPMYNVLMNDRNVSPRGYSYSFATTMKQPISTKSNDTTKIKYPICQLPVNSTQSNIPLDKSNDLKNKVYPQIEVKKYSTSAIDPLRNYLIVFEYQINNHWIIWDYETGFVHLTGIWKASLNDQQLMEEASLPKSNSKADIVKLLESTPKQYHPYIKRIRGGFLKIQGTWLPYNLCKVLARRFCYYIRYELIPIFGVDFPDYCLKPTDYGFGELKLDEVPDENLVFNGEIVIDPKKKIHRKTKSASLINTSLAHFAVSPPKEHRKKNSLPLVSLLPLPVPPQALVASPDQAVHPPDPITPEANIWRGPKHSWSAEDSAPVLRSNSDDISYNDMVDIVNASKCLQSLSRSGSLQTSPISYESAATGNYITTPKADPSGILTILVAASVSEPHRRASMKINDLLS